MHTLLRKAYKTLFLKTTMKKLIVTLTTIFLSFNASVFAYIVLEQQNKYIPATSNIPFDDTQNYFSTFKDEDISLENRFKAAEKLIFEYPEEEYKKEIKIEIFDIIKENQNVLLRNEIDLNSGEYFSAGGYKSLMLILKEFNDTEALPFLAKLTKKLKDFSGFELTSTSEYVIWALKNITIKNIKQVDNIENIVDSLNFLYEKAYDNQIANWANSALLEMSKSGIKQAEFDKKRKLFFMSSVISESDEKILKNINTQISSEGLMNYIKIFQDFKTRHSNTQGHEKAVNLILNHLEKFGLNPYLQEFDSYGNSYKNIIAQIKGISNPEEKIIICAHYDSIAADSVDMKSYAPGANDNATGISTLLEIARILKESDIGFNRTIEFVFFDAEETGKKGSNYYVRQALLNDESIKAVLNIDSIGWDTDNKLELVSNAGSEELLDTLIEISKNYLPQQQLETSIMKTGYGDENNFWQAAHRGNYNAVLMTGDMDNPDPKINTSYDTLKHLDSDFLENAAKFVLTATTALANPLDPIETLVNNFAKNAEDKGIKIVNNNVLKYRFNYDTLKEIFFAFELIPVQHLKVLNTIVFENLKFNAGIFDTDKGIITVSTANSDLAATAIVHETGHLNYHDLLKKMPDMNFKGDYEFLCEYYYKSTNIAKESINPAGLIDETFAVMYHMYILEPEELKNWIEKRTEIGDKLALNNYNFMKNIVFSGREY